MRGVLEKGDEWPKQGTPRTPNTPNNRKMDPHELTWIWTNSSHSPARTNGPRMKGTFTMGDVAHPPNPNRGKMLSGGDPENGLFRFGLLKQPQKAYQVKNGTTSISGETNGRLQSPKLLLGGDHRPALPCRFVLRRSAQHLQCEATGALLPKRCPVGFGSSALEVWMLVSHHKPVRQEI